MSVEFDRESPGKFDSRTLNRETLSRWTGRNTGDTNNNINSRNNMIYTYTYAIHMYISLSLYIYIYISIYVYILYTCVLHIDAYIFIYRERCIMMTIHIIISTISTTLLQLYEVGLVPLRQDQGLHAFPAGRDDLG